MQLYNFTGTYPLGASVVPAAGGWTSQGCYRYESTFVSFVSMMIDRALSDSVSSRTLERSVNAGNVTVESCVSACQAESFTKAGLEYAQECCKSNYLHLGLALTDNVFTCRVWQRDQLTWCSHCSERMRSSLYRERYGSVWWA